jgi:5-methylcytosine-specific restriction enzyme subunit McrC
VKPVELDELGPGAERLLTPEQGRSLAGSGVVTAAPSPYRPGAWQIDPAGKVGAARVCATAWSLRHSVLLRVTLATLLVDGIVTRP